MVCSECKVGRYQGKSEGDSEAFFEDALNTFLFFLCFLPLFSSSVAFPLTQMDVVNWPAKVAQRIRLATKRRASRPRIARVVPRDVPRALQLAPSPFINASAERASFTAALWKIKPLHRSPSLPPTNVFRAQKEPTALRTMASLSPASYLDLAIGDLP